MAPYKVVLPLSKVPFRDLTSLNGEGISNAADDDDDDDDYDDDDDVDEDDDTDAAAHDNDDSVVVGEDMRDEGLSSELVTRQFDEVDV